MVVAKQMDVRSNIKKYFDLAYDGETVIVPRKQDKNIVIISEEEYRRLDQLRRVAAYRDSLTAETDKMKPYKVDIYGNVKSRNMEKLSVISKLKDNWNGNGAAPFTKKLIEKVTDIVDKLLIQPEIFPTALGTIQLEFDNSRRDHMELEIGELDEAEIFIVYYNGVESFENIAVSAETINHRVGDFYG